jgi:hypothetical protein
MKHIPHLPNEIIHKIIEFVSPYDLCGLRGVSKSWCHITTPGAFRIICMNTTLKGASGLYEILQSEQFRDYVNVLILVLQVDYANFSGACYQVKFNLCVALERRIHRRGSWTT